MRRAVRLLLLVTCAPFAGALEPHTEHTYRLAEGEAAPKATLEDVAWLAGNWRGEAFGKTFEEVWNPPSAGSMVGLFKLIDGDDVDFYELLTITMVDGGLELRVKHFTKDFVAWEDKDDFVSFELVGVEAEAIHFSGMSFYRRGDDQMEAFIVFRHGAGVTEERLTYHRVR